MQLATSAACVKNGEIPRISADLRDDIGSQPQLDERDEQDRPDCEHNMALMGLRHVCTTLPIGQVYSK